MKKKELKAFLDEKVEQYNRPSFIPDDPVSIPHIYSKKQDIEIMGFFAAVLAWGRRATIISKCQQLGELMENQPHEFVVNHSENDLKRFLNFRHRTFNPEDALYFIEFFHWFYKRNTSLEIAFSQFLSDKTPHVGLALEGFHKYFFSLEDYPERTKKHIATPARNSACKRLNMFLRWMVRRDDKGVDFGLWDSIQPRQLICPCDVHVDRVARKLGLLTRDKPDWLAALELTENLRKLDSQDPVKYDFALFGLGVEGAM